MLVLEGKFVLDPQHKHYISSYNRPCMPSHTAPKAPISLSLDPGEG